MYMYTTRCTFGTETVVCSTAHNYFHDFDPIENVSGTIVLWKDDACDPSKLSMPPLPHSPVRRMDTAGDSAAQEIISMTPKLATLILDDGSKGLHWPSPEVQDIPTVIVFVRRGGCAFATKVERDGTDRFHPPPPHGD
jgi:hypothetical protein